LLIAKAQEGGSISIKESNSWKVNQLEIPFGGQLQLFRKKEDGKGCAIRWLIQKLLHQ